jgi:hypothetical protein
MNARMLVPLVIPVGFLAAMAPACAGEPGLPVVEQVRRGVLSDPLTAVEASRTVIVERLAARHRDALAAGGVTEAAFRAALASLRADQLLAAALVDTVEDVSAIVAMAPPGAVMPKDGSGSGPNSWIGYTAGSNVASGSGSAVAAGKFNKASGQGAFVGAGQSNVAGGTSSLVIGGFDNQATAIDSLVGAGAGNRATGARSVVVGGGYNLASGQWSVVGGGGRQTGSGLAGGNAQDNVASGDFSTVAGGQGNRATAVIATVSGGAGNVANGNLAAIGGGQSNTAGTGGVVGGGDGNIAGGLDTTVGGGNGNVAGGSYSTIGGGSENVSSGTFGSVVAGGQRNQASANWSAVAGGADNVASGIFSFAAGYNLRANQNNCFMLGGWSNTSLVAANCLGTHDILRMAFLSGMSVEYYFPRDDGGGQRWVHIGQNIAGQTIATWTGASLSDTGVWNNASDRNLKDEFTPIDTEDVLARVAALPIQRWHYRKDVPDVRHIGPVAQDFHAAFGLGDSDKAIGTIDADGVALAAIQGLNRKLEARSEQIERLERALGAREHALDALMERLADLERRLAER